MDNSKILKYKIEAAKESKKFFEDDLKKTTDKIAKYKIDFGIKNSSVGFIQSIKNFFKSEMFNFIHNYLFLLIVFTLCFYILLNVSKKTTNYLVIYETNIFFYLIIFLIMIFINDLLGVSQENLFKFIGLIILSLVACYYGMKFINDHTSDKSNIIKLLFIIFCCIAVIIIAMIIFYFEFKRKSQYSSYNLMNTFNKIIKKNYIFMIFILIYVFFYSKIFNFLNWNSSLSDIICPTVIGCLLLCCILFYLIFIALKMKIINNIQILNSFIALLSIVFFIVILKLYIFLTSLNTVCTEVNPVVENSNSTGKITVLILISLFIILWLDDTRTWHQLGSILFICASAVTLVSMFYYSTIYPSISILSLWLFIEWMIIMFRQKENSKNSFHYSFMKV
jgi:hypothetical protein